ncbi:MAG: hypothetical protein Q9160_006623 [Pyrenula sp. 1 TL-2023]
MPSNWSIQHGGLSPPLLSSLPTILHPYLSSNFTSVSVSLVDPPDLRLAPFHLAAAGLCGSPCIIDVGGPKYLHPFPNLNKKYDFLDIAAAVDERLGQEPGGRLMIGASAGPFHVLGGNAELVPNIAWDDGADEVGHRKVKNETRWAKVGSQGEISCGRMNTVNEPSEQASSAFGLMANLFYCSGEVGEVLKVSAQGRKGPLNFTECIRQGLRSHFGEKHPVSIGGVFLIKRGKARLHVMPEFSEKALVTPDDVKNWLRFFEVDAPLVCLTTFHTEDLGLELRMEHTHCFSEDGTVGGHYHADTTPEEAEYEAYLNTADSVWRVDQP